MLNSGRTWLAVFGVVAGAAAAWIWLADGSPRGAPIRVAFAGPTTGPSAEDGLAGARAVELIFAQVNDAGGIDGRPLVLDVYDDGNDPARARANAPLIADETSTVAVIGHNFSTCSIAAGEVYAARGIPAISSAATSVAVTRDNPWYFRTIFNDRAQGRFIALYLKQVLGAPTIGIASETDAYGAYLGGVIDEAAREFGLPVAATWSFDPASPQLAARLDEISRQAVSPEGPAVLVLAMQPGAGVQLVRRLRDAKFPGEIVVTDALASQAFVDGFRALPQGRSRPGFYTDGIYASTPFLFDAGGKRAGAFMLDYVTRYDQAPQWYAAFAADAATVLVEALRRAQISPSRDTIERDRAALRDALAAIGPTDPVPGVTGPTGFDAFGDADKPVSMGRFIRGEIVSAFGQLRLIPGVFDPANLDDRFDPARVVRLDDQILYRTDVARVGVRVERFDSLDFDEERFDLDFHIWFRHAGDRGVEDVVFTNAIEPVALGEPEEEVIDDGGQYRLYRVRGAFRADTIDAGYAKHSLALSFHHRERTRDDLVFALDSVGMNLGRERTREERIDRGRRLLGNNSAWVLEDLLFFEAVVDEPAMGRPSYLAGAAASRPFSQLTIAAIVRSQTLGLRGLLPPQYQRGLLVLGLVGSFVLLVLGDKGSPGVRWLLQAIFAALILMGAEPLLGNWIRTSAEPYHLRKLERVFDLLWWVVPAVFANLAVDRFVWMPTARRTGQPVPTLLRYTVTTIICLLALFGIIAFVYDYRLTGILATSGVMAMIVGLAVQLNITNLFAGVALNLERPFRVGDWIMIHGRTPDPDDGVIGKVIDINWRTTRLETADDTVIVIPNGVISEKTITNFMSPDEISRFELCFTVDQAVPPDRVLTVIQAALDSLAEPGLGPLVADPAPSVRIRRVTENGVEYLVRYRASPSQVSPTKARHLVNERVIRHLREAGIELAYPRRRVQEIRADTPSE